MREAPSWNVEVKSIASNIREPINIKWSQKQEFCLSEGHLSIVLIVQGSLICDVDCAAILEY